MIDAAVGAFVTHGYQHTQMQDIAEAVGLAKGTLYGYAATKEALFAAAIRYGDHLEPLPETRELPLGPPAVGDLARLVSARLGAEVPDLALVRALASDSQPETPEEVAVELSGIVTDLFARLARNRAAIKLVDRCAPELPELGRVWFDAGRGAQMSAMESYLRARQESGLLAVPGSVAVVARTIVELCVLWAVHCRFDPAPLETSPNDDDTVAATLAAMITRSMHPTGGG